VDPLSDDQTDAEWDERSLSCSRGASATELDAMRTAIGVGDECVDDRREADIMLLEMEEWEEFGIDTASGGESGRAVGALMATGVEPAAAGRVSSGETGCGGARGLRVRLRAALFAFALL
jgi:hypothetical protein